MCLKCSGEKLERERESAQDCLENHFVCVCVCVCVQNEGFGGIYIGKMPLWLPAHLVGLLATLLMSTILAFSEFNFGRIF